MSIRNVRIVVDGTPRQVAPGGTILGALHGLGIAVPSLCHDDRLRPLGGCRLCLVGVSGAPHPVPACATELTEGMAIETRSPEIEERRRWLLGLLARGYPAEVVAQEPELPFHQLLRRYGVEAEPGETREAALRDDSHPYLKVDLSRCIDCYRCVRICGEVQGQDVWQVLGRGEEARVGLAAPTLLASGCVSCGACADTCPTGAISDRSAGELGKPEAWTRTTCTYCGVGCELEAGVRGGTLVAVRPAAGGPVARGHACVKGRYAFGFGDAGDRVRRPHLRDGSRGWREVSWEEAIGWTAERLRAILAEHGADAIGVLGSARATNEEAYLTQKLARAVLGTHNVDCCARVCHAPSAAGLTRAFGTGAATSSFDDIERARTLLVVGANSTESHPVVGARLRQAALRGANLIVVDPRHTELARAATVHLRLRPGTNVPLLNAVACALLEEGLEDRDFLARRAEGVAEYAAAVRAFTPEHAERLCGVPAAEIRRAAQLYSRERPALALHGLGLTEHTQGTDGVTCLANLALLTGNLGRPGSGIVPLRGQNNVQGAAHMGCEPTRLAGYQPLAVGRPRTEEVWGVTLPSSPGLDWMAMVDAAAAGRLAALYAIGYDVFLSNPRAAATRRALESLELVVVQDLFWSETAANFAHVFLPVASAFEKDGTFMNAERRVQRVRRAVPPPDGVLADWQVLCRLAAALGKGELFPYTRVEEIWDEVRAVWPAGAGMTYRRLDVQGLQWPCPDVAHPGTALLHTEAFAAGGTARLRAVDYRPSPETTTPELPFLLITGRSLYAFNADTMTGRTANRALRPGDLLDISAADASRLGIADGELVRVSSRWGETVLPAAISPIVAPGELFATFHTARVFLNRLTGPQRDTVTGTPEYKVTAVAVERC